MIELSGEEGLKFSYTYNVDGKVTSATDALGNTVNLEYDAAGQLIKETNVLGDARVYIYTALGKIETVTDEAGRVTRHEYEPGGRLKSIMHPDGTTESFEYDGNNNVVSHTNKTGQTTVYKVDSLNRVVSIIANGGEKKYSYDAVGNIVSMIDELGNATNYTYTLTGQLESVTDALGNVTLYKYDLLDNLIEVSQEGAGINDNQDVRISKYERNIMGQIKLVEDALGNKETYAYSAKGQLTGKLDKDGFITKYGYTAQGDLNHIQYEDGREVTMSYNALRHLTEIHDWLGTTQIEVDALGRTTRVSNHNDKIVEYEYGSSGERKQVTYPSGKTVGYEYDSALRLTKVSDVDQEINYSYDQLGRFIGKQFGNDVETEYVYDSLGRLSELMHLNGKDVLDSYKYSYDVLGNRTQIEKVRQGIEADSGLFSYTYDSLNRLQSVAKDGNLLRSYSYDSFGNRTSMLDGGKEINYQFNSLNQLIASTDSEGLSQHYNFDKRGNLIEAYRGDDLVNKYHFGVLNRLESTYNFEKSLGAVYSYNGLGDRVGTVEGKPLPETISLEKIVLDPARQVDDVIDMTRQYNNLLERSENSQEISYLYDSGILSASFKDHRLNYLADNLGSPVRLVHGSGAEVDVFGYDEFGRSVTDHDPKTFNTFGFASYQLDGVTGDYFAQARQYDPTSGRFTSQDEIVGFAYAPKTLNAYSYCWNSPMKYVDLDGRFPSLGDIADWFRERGSNIRISADDTLRTLNRGVDLIIRGSFNGVAWWNIRPARRLANERYEAAWDFAEMHQTYNIDGYISPRWNLGDAYRHFSWMFEETVARGANGARFIGDQNELVFLDSLFHGSPRNYMLARFDMDTIMDLYNNSVGIEMGMSPEHQNSSSYEAFWYAQRNGWLIDDIRYVSERLGIFPDGDRNGTVLGSWDLINNTLRLIDDFGTTTLCLDTREHVRAPHPGRD